MGHTAPKVAVGLVWLLLAASLVTMAILDRRLERAGRDDLSELLTPEAPMYVLASVSAAVVGSALVLRDRRGRVGWLLLALAVTVVPSGTASSYAAYGTLARPGSLPGASFVAVACDMVFIVWLALIALIVLWTPSGRRPDGPWGWVAPAAIVGAGVVLTTGFFSEYELDPPYEEVTSPLAIVRDTPPVIALRILGLVAVHVAVVGAAASLVSRFRRSSGDERLQLRWVAAAAVPLVVLVLVAVVVATLDGPTILLAIVAGLFLAVFPVAAGLAIVRYQLFDVDRLASRAISYVVLTGVVVVTFLAVVLLLGATLGRVAGRSQGAAVVATLAAVSVAWPAASRVQRLVDRRFNRRAFDAVQVVRTYVADPAPGSSVEEVLRSATGDPTLEVAYWIPDGEVWVAQDGRPVPADSGGVVVRRRDTVIARVAVDGGRVPRQLVDRVVAEARPELESAQLRAAIAAQLVEVRESRARIVAAQLAERRSIERNLHDGAQQRLLAVAMQLRAAEVSGNQSQALAVLPGAVDQVQQAIVELRALANGLQPVVLADGGLAAALDDLAARIPVAVRLDATHERFDPQVEATAWYIACEAVTNAIKHGRPSTLDITASRRDGSLVVVIADDGPGGADPAGGGLRGLADRAEATGGRLDVRTRDGGGTVITAELPVRVVIADDSVLLREGLARLLAEAGMETVGSVGDGVELEQVVHATRPDLALVDIRMPPTFTHEGSVAATRLRVAFPDLGILLLSQSVESRHALELARRHPSRFGYLLKDRVLDVATLVDAVERVAAGGTVLDPDVVAHFLGRHSTRDRLSTLTDHEREVLGLMAEGRSNRALARLLVLHDKTVESHVASIFTKLDLLPEPDDHRRVLAVLAWLQQ